MPEPGELLAGKYRLKSVLGRGGMGIVFEVHHELLDRAVAIKVLAPEVLGSQEAVSRFMNEARAAAKITSDRVVHVLDVGVLDGGLPFMVMEKLDGRDLGDLLREPGALDVDVVVDLLVEAAEGVAHAHVEGIIHRDLKPSNLFLAERPDRSTVVKVLDFGISKLTSPGGGSTSGSVTSTNTILGSPLYMSPEQLLSAKTIDGRADIWSLGVIAYRLLTQAVPFDGDNLVEIFAKIQERDARPLTELRADVPPELDEVVRRCLQREADDRPPTTLVLARDLAPFGTPRAQAALGRIEAHAASRGLTSDGRGASRPPSAPRNSRRADVPFPSTRLTGRSADRARADPAEPPPRASRSGAGPISPMAIDSTQPSGSLAPAPPIPPPPKGRRHLPGPRRAAGANGQHPRAPRGLIAPAIIGTFVSWGSWSGALPAPPGAPSPIASPASDSASVPEPTEAPAGGEATLKPPVLSATPDAPAPASSEARRQTTPKRPPTPATPPKPPPTPPATATVTAKPSPPASASDRRARSR